MDTKYLSIVFFIVVLSVTSIECSWEEEWRKSGKSLKDAGFVMRGKKTVLTCPGVDKRSVDPSDMVFTWLDCEKNKIAHSRATTQNDGSLEIEDAQPSDSGNYTCQIKDSVGNLINEASQDLLVFQMPLYTLRVLLTYEVAQCDSSLGEEKVGEIIERLCDEEPCPFTVDHDCAPDDTAETSTGKNDLAIIVTVSLNKKAKIPKCSVYCMKEMIMKHLNEDYAEIEALVEEEREETGEGMRFRKDKLTKDTTKGCMGGYEPFHETVCVPCQPGTSSHAGAFECKPCKKHTYQPGYGMTECFNCPKKGKTEKKGSKNEKDCTAPGEINIHLEVPSTNNSNTIAAIIASVIIAIVFAIIGFAAYKVISGPPSKKGKYDVIKQAVDDDSVPILQISMKKTNDALADLPPKQPGGKGSRQSRVSKSSKRSMRSFRQPNSYEQMDFYQQPGGFQAEQYPVYQPLENMYEYPAMYNGGTAPQGSPPQHPSGNQHLAPQIPTAQPGSRTNWNQNALLLNTSSLVSSTERTPGSFYSRSSLPVHVKIGNADKGLTPPRGTGSGNRRHIPLSKRLSSLSQVKEDIQVGTNNILQGVASSPTQAFLSKTRTQEVSHRLGKAASLSTELPLLEPPATRNESRDNREPTINRKSRRVLRRRRTVTLDKSSSTTSSESVPATPAFTPAATEQAEHLDPYNSSSYTSCSSEDNEQFTGEAFGSAQE